MWTVRKLERLNTVDEGQKEWEAFTAKERDRFYGETADFNDEAAELKEDISLEKLVPHIESVLVDILKAYIFKQVYDRDTIVINSKFKDAAEIVARKYRLNLAIHPDFPNNKIFVEKQSMVETLIVSQVAQLKGYIPSTILTGVRMHRP